MRRSGPRYDGRRLRIDRDARHLSGDDFHNPNGARWWRIKYRFGGKEKLLSLGVYPEVGLKEARQRRDECRHALASGVNPSDTRKTEHAVETATTDDSLETVAREWYEKQLPSWTQGYSKTVLRRLELYVFPILGSNAMADVV